MIQADLDMALEGADKTAILEVEFGTGVPKVTEFLTEYVRTATRYLGNASDPFRARRREISEQMYHQTDVNKRLQLQAECAIMDHVFASEFGAFEDEGSHGRVCLVCNRKEDV